MALFQRFWRRLTVISHAERLITDEPSSVGEIVMIGAGRIEHRELNYYTIRKATFFGPPARKGVLAPIPNCEYGPP